MVGEDFDSTENAEVWLPPFRDTTTGAPISGDTVTLKLKSPNGTLYTQATSGVTLATQDTDTLWRKLTISNATLYTAGGGAGVWTIMAASSNANAVDMPGSFSWGNRAKETLRLIKAKTDNIPATTAASASDITAAIAELKSGTSPTLADIKTKTDNLPSDPASESLIEAAVSAIITLIGTPAGADVSSDIAALLVAINSAATSASSASSSAASAAAAAASTLTIAQLLQKIGRNRWKVEGTQLVYYDDDLTTAILRWDLKDSAGQPSSTQIFERVPTTP